MRWIDDVSRRNSLRSYESISARKVLPFDDIPPSSAARTIKNLTVETVQLPRIKRLAEDPDEEMHMEEQTPPSSGHESPKSATNIRKFFMFLEPKGCSKERDEYSLYLFAPNNRYTQITPTMSSLDIFLTNVRVNRFRQGCLRLVDLKWFDNAVLMFIGLNCITLAMERPNIPPDSGERIFLATANYLFTIVFAAEMFVKVALEFLDIYSSVIAISMIIPGSVNGYALWPRRLFHVRMEHNGRIPRRYFHHRSYHVSSLVQ